MQLEKLKKSLIIEIWNKISIVVKSIEKNNKILVLKNKKIMKIFYNRN